MNEHEYNISVNKLQTYIDSITKILSDMDDLVFESEEYFSGTFGEAFQNKYSQFQLNHKHIIENLNTLKNEYMDNRRKK